MYKEQNLVLFIIFVSVAFLLYGISQTSISYEEAELFFRGSGILHVITNYSTELFGQNDFALRGPFLFLHVISLFLIYKVSKHFLKNKLDRVFSVGVYALLPGVNSAAILVNPSIIVIVFTLLFIYFMIEKLERQAYVILFLTLFIDNSFIMLYFSLIFYAIHKKEKFLLGYSLILLSVALSAYGFDTGGKPRGYFLDTLGGYAAVFSPFVFLYFVYAMYRVLIKEEKNLLWFIGFCTLVLSLLLSFRQKLQLEDFAPFVVIAVPLMVRIFFNSYRVRLPIHRKMHNLFLTLILGFLAFNFMTTVTNKYIYLFLDEPHKHFAYKYHIAKDLARKLHTLGVSNIKTDDYKLQERLKFYGIYGGGVYELALSDRGKKDIKSIQIEYYEKPIEKFFLYR